MIKDTLSKKKKKGLLYNIKKSKYLLILLIPATAYYIIFHYVPMYGIIIAFKDFSPIEGFIGSPWIGLKWFKEFFSSVYASRIIRNTLLLSFYSLLWGFPVPIIFAILLNEIKDGLYKRSVQTISYLPHFVSVVIIVGMMFNMLGDGGIIYNAVKSLTGDSYNFMADPKWFRTIYVSSGIYQSFGFSAIIYLSALSTVDPQLYDAAKIDGANRLRRIIHITLPGIMPMIVTMLILSVGQLMSVGFEKIILLYSPATYETADVIATYVYRAGILEGNFELGTAIGLFNSVVNLLLLVSVNWFARTFSDYSLY